MDTLIKQQAAIDLHCEICGKRGRCNPDICVDMELFRNLQSADPDALTDKEQRIFLAAMAREERICEEVDRNYVREPYEDSLMRVCKDIRRKVKDALWT